MWFDGSKTIEELYKAMDQVSPDKQYKLANDFINDFVAKNEKWQQLSKAGVTFGNILLLYGGQEIKVGDGVKAPFKSTYKVAVAKGVNNIIPEGSLASHLFKGAGKLVDNPANRALIEEISNGKALGVDKYGKAWFTGVGAAGKSIYTYTQNGVVKGAGYMSMTAEEMITKYGLK
jgi:hypothetical protein